MRLRGLGRVRRIASSLRDRFGTVAAILMYHRVADAACDPFALAVTPAHFRDHLDVLRKRYRPLPLREFARLHQSGNLPSRAIAVTFDDGYVDNLRNAAPLLRTARVPATVFVTSGGGGRSFWWDELSEMILAPRALPQEGRLAANGSSLQWSMTENEASSHWRPPRGDLTLPGVTLDARSRLFCDVHHLLQPLLYDERDDALAQFRDLTRASRSSQEDARSMNPSELRELATESLIEIGAHTVTHPLLISQPPHVQEAEIRESKARVEELVGRTVVGMSYPWGEYQPQTLHAVGAAGYEYACACGERPVLRSARAFELPRINVEDCDGDTFADKLEGFFQ